MLAGAVVSTSGPSTVGRSEAHGGALLRGQVRAQDFPKPDFESSSSFQDAAALSAGSFRPAHGSAQVCPLW